MEIILEQAGKRYNREWIFRNFNYHFFSGTSYAVTGPNGSGKSTLLQTLSGALDINEGSCTWKKGNILPVEIVYEHTSFVAPYLELVEEMTALEFLGFHFQFKDAYKNFKPEFIIEETQLTAAKNRQIRYFSSGMKQRLKLAQAIFSATEIILLDEPCTNLDNQGFQLYNHLINTYCKEKLVVVSSNDVNEYQFCEQIIDILDYK